MTLPLHSILRNAADSEQPISPSPLSALLSQASIAFTIEFDNEFERRVPHRTSETGASADLLAGPWLVSRAMWMKFLRFVPADGISLRDLQPLTGFSIPELRRWLTRLSKWWGYLVFLGDRVIPTPGGLRAMEVWRQLDGLIEKRWRKRFGADHMDALQTSLLDLTSRFEFDLPDCLPILGYGLFTKQPSLEKAAVSENTLPALLSKALMAFAIGFENEAEVSLAISANVLRLTEPAGIRVRDLPGEAGVSKETIATSLSYLAKRGYAVKSKVVNLTAQGEAARSTYFRLTQEIEKRWQTHYGVETVSSVRNALDALIDMCGENGESLLLNGIEPQAGNWRASRPPMKRLAHFPITLHRGGYPDGS